MTKIRDAGIITLLANQRVTSSANGTGQAIAGLKDFGKAIITVEAVSGTTPTLAMKLQDSITVGGSYADVAGGGFTTLAEVDAEEAIDIYLDGLKEFLRIALTLTGTTPVYGISCVLMAK